MGAVIGTIRKRPGDRDKSNKLKENSTQYAMQQIDNTKDIYTIPNDTKYSWPIIIGKIPIS